jgi:recombination protein RecR
MDTEKRKPDLIDNLIHQLSQLPSIGKKSAERLAYFLLRHESSRVEDLAHAILDARRKIRNCIQCHNYTEHERCRICTDSSRSPDLICVVEKSSDILLLERFGAFRGLYHVLGGCLSPLDGVGPDDLTIQSLMNRVRELDSPELILALNTSAEGEATIMYLIKSMQNLPVRISRLASGIPVGTDLQYIDELTMKRSLENRIPV